MEQKKKNNVYVKIVALPRKMETHLEQRLLKVIDTLTTIELRAFWCYKRKLKGLRKVSDSEIQDARKAARCCVRQVLSAIGGETESCMVKLVRTDEVLYCFVQHPEGKRTLIFEEVEAFNLLPLRVQREVLKRRGR